MGSATHDLRFRLSKALLTDIVQLEPKATAWLQGIAWQLEVASTCPVTDLPDSQYWQKNGEVDPFDIIAIPASAMPVHAPVPDPMADPGSVVAITPSTPVTPVLAAAAVPTFDLDELEPLASVAEKPPTPENDATEDLERLFAITDRELKQPTVSKPLPQGYEKPSPRPFRRSGCPAGRQLQARTRFKKPPGRRLPLGIPSVPSGSRATPRHSR